MGRPEGFTSVATFDATWEPKQTGSKKDGNLVHLQPDPEKSWISGYYVGSEEIPSKTPGQSPSHSHTFEVVEFGDESQVQGEMTNNRVQVWGTGVLNNMIYDNLEKGKIVVGSLLFVEWLGKKPSKTPGGNDYHTWDVQVSDSVPPKNFGGSKSPAPKNESQPDPNPVTPDKVNAAMTDDADDDDLPF